MMRLTLVLYLASGSLGLADIGIVYTTRLKPSSVTQPIVDTKTYTRIFKHDAIEQNEVLAPGFSKAQSIAASAADVVKRSSKNSPVSNQPRASRDSDDLPKELSYFTMVLSVNGYDVTVPILTDNATDFCKTVSSELESSASHLQASTDANEPTETPVNTHTSKIKHTSEGGEPQQTTTPEDTNNTATDTARTITEPTNKSTKSHRPEITSTGKPSETTTPDLQNSPEDTSTSSAKNGPSSIVTTGTDDNPTLDRTSASRSTFSTVTEDPPTTDPASESNISNKYTITPGATTATIDDTSTITTMFSSDDTGKSHDLSQVLAESSEAWASYNSYIDGLHSRLSERVPNNQIDTPTSTEGPTPTEDQTTHVDKPARTESEIAIRQQKHASQAADMRNILRWIRPPFIWGRSTGYHLHNSSEIEQVQGFSHKSDLESSKNKRQYPYLSVHNPLTEKEDFVSKFMAQEEPMSTNSDVMTTTDTENGKPTFGFDPHPHPRPPFTEDKPLPSFTPHTTKTPISTSTEPSSIPELGDTTDPPSPSPSSPIPSDTIPGNATHTGPGNVTQPTEPTSGAHRHWSKNPFASPIFWGTGAWYLLMAYWEGWQQARGEWEWGWTDGMCRWIGGNMVRYL
ncbi:uncharacterized protein N0V89_003132 [Didymosphaeria variabile]|uniref:Uncharacterized protein n=1 Tax=Didymosphaeria variabile TaxID=1932322 RepID=A0A9W8XVH9_9PLEO|nr:uncharacterized protein N0V89_003132 [Didymosphaeria variabile]KAJ4358548.1 hypothetical protein N0V89_003132 [Didymosphaeria variabile]